jgi:hypothetical protein
MANKHIQNRTFRVKQNISKKPAKRKKKITKRTIKRNWKNQVKPMLSCPNICYDNNILLNEKTPADIGAMHISAGVLSGSYRGSIICSLSRNHFKHFYAIPGRRPENAGVYLYL